MAVRTGHAAAGSVGGTVLDSLRPRLKELRYSLHLLRKSPLAMVGLGIVAFFFFIAAFGPSLAPYRYSYNDLEKNGPPWSRPLVTFNVSGGTYEGTGWSGTEWLKRVDENSVTDSETHQCNPCGLYARSDALGDTLALGHFALAPYTDGIEAVLVVVQANSTEARPGSVLSISVSWDNGTSWSAPQITPLRFSDRDGAWFQPFAFTNATNWNRAKLEDSYFRVRLVHALDPQFDPADPHSIGVDIVRVVVRFRGMYHVLGTTVDGEDVLTGLLLGARISIRIGLIVTVVATLIGSVLGALAGYYGGVLDELIMRVTDVFLAIPGLILALAVAAALGHSLDNVMFALITVYWPSYTRLVRAQALSVRENLYVEAARASGASETRVVTRHILPNTLSPILVQAAFDLGTVVLVAAGLSYLGLGAQPGTPEWGLMVSKGFQVFPTQNWWQVTFAGLMIFLFVLGFNLIGDGVRDILDPRLRR